MTRNEKRLLIVIIVIVAAAALTAAAVAIAVYRAGMLVVEVEPESGHGSQVHVHVPAFFAEAALRFVPDRVFEQPARDARDWLPVLEAASAEIPASPDGVLLEVHSPDAQVEIVKAGRKVQIDVHDTGQAIHVELPITLLPPLLSRLERLAPDTTGS